MKYFVTLLSSLFFALISPLSAQERDNDEHSHKETEHEGKDHNQHNRGASRIDAESKDHGHKEEGEEEHSDSEHGHADEAENVGPNKGILEVNEAAGFKLSPEALKNFEIKTLKLQTTGPWTIPANSRVFAGEEVNLFRVRDGYFKRIDFSSKQRVNDQLAVNSPDLKSGDEVVVQGIGFLRIAELAAFGGVAEGHSH